MFFDKSKWLEQSWYRITKGIFLQIYIAIGPVVSDKKIFLTFLYRYIGKISPAPWRPCFWQEDFLSFLYRYIGKISPAHWRPCFLTNPNGMTILVESHQRNISAKLYWNRSGGFWQEDFLSFLYRYIGKISPAPWRPYFLTNPNGLNILGRGSPKEHFCKIIWKSVQWFLTRRFFKFSIEIYWENKPRPLAAMFFDESKWLEQPW